MSSSLMKGIVTLGALAFATSALADGGTYRRGSIKDEPIYAPAPFSWTGFYVGGHVGGCWSDHSYNYVQPPLLLNERLDFSSSGFMGGGQVGYQAQLHNWLLGVEVSYSALDMSETVTSTAILDRSRTMSVNDLIMTSLRVGRTWDRWLAYVKGGYASAEVDIRSNVISTGTVTSKSSHRESGWNIGTGVEYAVTPNVILGVQYDFVSLDASDRLDVGNAGFVLQHHRSIETDIHAVTARLNWKFSP